ncbi:hypothetical protein EX30DRAFT_352603 [Ascodesmis nigricans]|uniref:Myb-like domain-containing protein n=1 Tax=Ascodesmis nigricans TaxID=341454 RepID=A0A4S2MHV7_9PEZI|nr:hypothetical protein EX30DRAFT_352603 [Ascodesmis nigricans]
MDTLAPLAARPLRSSLHPRFLQPSPPPSSTPTTTAHLPPPTQLPSLHNLPTLIYPLLLFIVTVPPGPTAFPLILAASLAKFATRICPCPDTVIRRNLFLNGLSPNGLYQPSNSPHALFDASCCFPAALTPLATMLLPSALPCELRPQSRAASVASVASPLRRSSRNISMAAPFDAPAQDPTATLVASGLIQTCRRLQSILSLNRLSSQTPTLAPTGPFNSGIRKTRRASEIPSSTSSSSRTRRARAPKTPIRRHKRTCDRAFASNGASSPMAIDEKEDQCDRSRFSTPPPTKRTRLTTPPPAPDRGPARWNRVSNQLELLSDLEDNEVWTDAEDRQLVNMVLGKLELTKEEWDQCAIVLGKRSGEVVGKRWMDLLGHVDLNKERRRQLREQNSRTFKRTRA